MIILRDKLFFDYAAYAKEHGQYAADKLHAERNRIAKDLLAKRNEHNNGFLGGLKENLKYTRKYHPKGDDRISSIATDGVKTIRKKGEGAEKFYYRHRNNRHEAAIAKAQKHAKQAEEDFAFAAKLGKDIRKGFKEASEKTSKDMKSKIKKINSSTSKKFNLPKVKSAGGKVPSKLTARKLGAGLGAATALAGAGYLGYKAYKKHKDSKKETK